MFRPMKIKPPNGWNSVAWELVIVTLGVLIALAAQQWVNEREWDVKVVQSRESLRNELKDHYFWSVEWRVVKPCLVAQIDALQRRVTNSGDRLDPAPIHLDRVGNIVLRLPAKEYVTSAWESAQSDGISSRFDPSLRRELNSHYAQVRKLDDLTDRNGVDYRRLLTLSRPIPLDPSVRYSITQTLDELHGRVEFVNLLSGQLIDHVVKLDMAPDRAATEREVKRWSTYKFCRANGLPTSPIERAMLPESN